MSSIINSKECTVCHEIKQLDLFYNRAAMKDGKESQCKSCSDKRNIKWANNNPDKFRTIKKRYLAKDEIRIKYNKLNRKFAHKHKFRRVASSSNTASKKKSTGEQITPKQLWILAKKQKLRCAISGIKLTNNNLSVDHVIPFFSGGKNVIENIQLVDKHINAMKNSHSQSDFLNLIKTIYQHNFKEKLI